MIGQENNKSIIDNFIENGSCPRFIILTGLEGSGKRTFSKYIADKLNADLLLFDNKIESVREVITTAYTQNKNIVYCIYGYENMSIAAKNALLKIAEEPPTNAYVVLTATNKNEVLDTLKSRAVVLDMEDYNYLELKEFADANNVNNEILDLCIVPLDIIKFKDINETEFRTFVDSVWDKIGNASIGNSLKLCSKLKLKDEQEGFDVNLFINCVIKKVVTELMNSPIPRHFKTTNIKCGINILNLCYSTKNKFNSNYNKQALLDNFIIKLRDLRNGII